MDISQRISKATAAFNSLSKCLWNSNVADTVKLRVYMTAIRPIMVYASELWSGTDNSVQERVDRAERKMLRRLFGHFYPSIPSRAEIYDETNRAYSRLTRGRIQVFPRASIHVETARLRYLGHVLRRPPNRIVAEVLRLLPDPSWKRRRGAPRQTWIDCLRAQLERMGLTQNTFPRGPWRTIWNSPCWIDALSEIAAQRSVWDDFVNRRITAAKALKDCARQHHPTSAD